VPRQGPDEYPPEPRPRCQFGTTPLGEEEFPKPGEDRYRGGFLCSHHAMVRTLEDRRNTLLSSVSVLDNWLEQNESNTQDELRVRRIKRWRGEALEQLTFTRQVLE
jgi:hypothetical protein